MGDAGDWGIEIAWGIMGVGDEAGTFGCKLVVHETFGFGRKEGWAVHVEMALSLFKTGWTL